MARRNGRVAIRSVTTDEAGLDVGVPMESLMSGRKETATA